MDTKTSPIKITTDNTSLESRLDEVNRNLLKLLAVMSKRPQPPEVAFQYKITTSNPSIELDATYYYDLSYLLVAGGATISSDVLLYIQYLGGTSNSMRDLNSPGIMTAYLNTCITGNRTKGFRISKIWTDSTLPAGATVYIMGIGQRDPYDGYDIKSE